MDQVLRDDLCFCCGQDNDDGLKLRFDYPKTGTAHCTLVIPSQFTGWQQMTHGGLLSMLLDEAMAHACGSSEGYAVTAELTVRYKKPVSVGTRIHVTGEVTGKRAKVLQTTGEIRNEYDRVIARATARFILADEQVAGDNTDRS